jgi:hypothetical protein
MINVFLALLFLSLGAASALGVTVLSPSSQVVTRTSDFLSFTTAGSLAGLVGGAVVFGGTVIIGGVLAWVIYEEGLLLGCERGVAT